MSQNCLKSLVGVCHWKIITFALFKQYFITLEHFFVFNLHPLLFLSRGSEEVCFMLCIQIDNNYFTH